jgi:diketogulonate reductase-like aldo/keto reductase
MTPNNNIYWKILDNHAAESFRSRMDSQNMDLPRIFTLNNGESIPAIGFGTFQGEVGNSRVKQAVKLALKLGYRHIDGANSYGNEKEIGEAIRECGIPRKEIYVTSKL